MKKLVAVAVALAFASGLTLQAAGGKKRTPLTPEQKQLRKDMIQKYDTNGNKRLEKDEIAKVTSEDKEKYEKAGIWPKQRKKKNQ